MFISPAFAQGAGDAGGGSMIVQLLPIILIFVVFYFLLIRPQQRRMKEHRSMVSNLRRGDRVVTGGGIIGTVTKVVNENELQLEIAEEVKVRMVKNSVQEVLSKTEPAEGQATQPAAEGGVKGMLGKLLGGPQGTGTPSAANESGSGQGTGGQSGSGRSGGGQSGGGQKSAGSAKSSGGSKTSGAKKSSGGGKTSGGKASGGSS